jgi:trans-aconitate methyltransferase
MPNDEEEQDRLQILNGVYFHLLDNRLTTVPLDAPEKILDVGTGTGEWAMAMADEYPDAEVIGTDIAKIQPGAAPLNVFFEIDDAEEEGGWTWPEDEFDFIHFRSMAGAFEDWRHIYNETLKHLKPGGWIEVLDFDNLSAFMSYFPEESDIAVWLRALLSATQKSGRPRSAVHMSQQILADVGFVDIKITEKFIPMGVWPEDKEELKIGKHFLIAQLCGVEAVCLRPLTEQLGWHIDDIRRYCDLVTEAVKSVALDPEKSRGLGFQVKILVGRKPGGFEMDIDSVMGDSVRTMTNGNQGVD